MPHVFSYLINEKVEVNGKQIFCKVTSAINSSVDEPTFVLMISSGPGLSHELTELAAARWLPLAHQNNQAMPHFIFYDSLGCGQSDKATDPDAEYNVNYYTDLAIALVEKIKEKLHLTKMNISVNGTGFGSLIAMNFPARANAWLESDAEVQLMQVNSITGNNGAHMQPYSREFLEKNFKDDPHYPEIVKAQEKLYAGDFKDQADYLCNFILPLATMYVQDIDKSASYKTLLFLAQYFPNALMKGIEVADAFTQYLGKPFEMLELYDITICKCAIDVLTHFYKKDFNGFNLTETVEKFKDNYKKIPICFITETKHYAIDSRDFQNMHNILPDSSALITFDHQGMLNQGKTREANVKLGYDLTVSHFIQNKDVDYSFLTSDIPQGFKDMLAKIRKSISCVDSPRSGFSLFSENEAKQEINPFIRRQPVAEEKPAEKNMRI